MAKTSPWHSIEPNAEVYHNNTKCTVGNNIEKKNIRPGTGGKRLCKQCEDLNKKGS